MSYSCLDLLVKFFNDTAVDQNTVSVVTDEAMGIDLDLTLFQQQLQFQVGEETMSIRSQSDISTNSLSSNSTTLK